MSNESNPKGCAKVAGGRSEAETSGIERFSHAPRRGARSRAPLRGCSKYLSIVSRWSATTGYLLRALRAETNCVSAT